MQATSNLLPGEEYIMPDQDKPFNADTFICEKFLEIKKKFKIKTVCELGSCVGGTAKWLGENFKRVVTIEISEHYRNICLQRIAGLDNVESILGNTILNLPDVLKTCNDQAIIFIDSHFGPVWPLLDELKIIAESGLKPVIAIHDALVPGHPELGYDSYNGKALSWDFIKESIFKIYGFENFRIEYNSESVGARRGIIFIYPKI